LLLLFVSFIDREWVNEIMEKINLMVDGVRLETSYEKNKKVRRCINLWKNIEERSYSLVRGIPVSSWNSSPSKHVGSAKSVRRTVVDEFDLSNGGENDWMRNKHAYEAVYKALESFESWRSNGMEGEPPLPSDHRYMRLSSNNSPDIVDNGSDGFGVRLELFSWINRNDWLDDKSVWFSADVGGLTEEYLERICDGELSVGNAEIYFEDSNGADDLYMNLSVSKEVEVPDVEDVDNLIGVDVGYSTLYSFVPVDAEEMEIIGSGIEIEGSGKYNHHRSELKEKMEEMQRRGDLKELKFKRDKERYTEHVMDMASRRVVESAEEYKPCVIVMEDLTGYRENLDEAIHDWPYRSFQEKVFYKAKERGIPVRYVEPENTSRECRKCSYTSEENRASRDDFECQECGYQVHADVNAGYNIVSKLSG
jgi:IS605 OrfB family transposase